MPRNPHTGCGAAEAFIEDVLGEDALADDEGTETDEDAPVWARHG